MIYNYGVPPVKERNDIGNLIVDLLIERYYPLKIMHVNTTSGGAREYIVDVNGRAVSFHIVPSHAHIQICGRTKEEIEETKGQIHAELQKKDKLISLEEL